MPSNRPPIPQQLAFKILYKAGFRCCVCRSNPAEQIHHIDQDRYNNIYENLIGLCSSCHHEAHTTHSMGRNLNPAILRQAKEEWEQEIERRSIASMVPRWGIGSYAAWAYFNFDKLPHLFNDVGIDFRGHKPELVTRGYINDYGIVRVNNFPGCRTIYDEIDFESGHFLYNMYTDAFNRFIPIISPEEFCITRKRTELLEIVREGTFVYFNRGVIFRRVSADRQREAFFRYNKINLKFSIDERFIWGSSCYTTHFVGSNTVFGVVLVRTIYRDGGELVFKCTPMALGYGYNANRDNSPFYDTLLSYGNTYHAIANAKT